MDYEVNEAQRKEMQSRANSKKYFKDSTVQELYEALGKLIEMGHGNAFVTVTDDHGDDLSIMKKEYTEEDIFHVVGTDYKCVWLREQPEEYKDCDWM